MAKHRPVDAIYSIKFWVVLLLFLAFRLNICQENKVKIGIIYDISAEIVPNVIGDHMNTFNSSCFPLPQINWLPTNSSKPGASRRAWSFIQSGIHILISALKCPQLTSVAALTETLRIPHLALDIDTCRSPRNRTYTFRLVNQFSCLPTLIDITAQREILILIDGFGRYTQQFVKDLSKAGMEAVLWTRGDLKPWTNQHKIIFIANNRQLLAIMRLTACSFPHHESSLVKKLKLNDGDECDRGPCGTADPLLRWVMQNVHALRKSDTKVKYEIDNDCSGNMELFDSSGEHTSIQANRQWTPTKRLSKHGDTHHPFKKGFDGITLRVGGLVSSTPFSNGMSGKDDRYHMFAVDIWDYIAADLNFKYVLVEPADGFYGHQLDNGTWTGIIGMIHRQEIDLGAGMFSLTTERSEVVDYTIPFIENSFSILTSKPEEHTDIFQFVKPFTTNVWLIIIVFGITTCITLVSMSHLTKHKHKTDVQILSTKDIVFAVIASFLEQGFPFYPHSISARCLCFFWLVFSLLIVSIYTAHLTAVLTVSTPIKSIDNLKDLSERTDLDVIALDGSSGWTLFQLSEGPLHQNIFSRLVPKTTFDDTLQKVMSDQACYIRGTLYLQYLVALTCGKVRISEGSFQNQFISFPIQKNSPFKEAIDNSLQRMMEAGIIDQLKKKWQDQTFDCIEGPKEEGKIYRLDMNCLLGVFLMLIGFVTLAVISCIVEYILIQAKRTCTAACINSRYQ